MLTSRVSRVAFTFLKTRDTGHEDNVPFVCRCGILA